MRNEEMAKKRRRRRKRFRLLIYERLWKRRARLWTLTILASIGLWWLPSLLSVTHILYRALALVPTFIALFIVLFASMARRWYWVQCRPNHLHIQTPLYPLTVSYARIKAVRPQPFAQVFSPSQTKALHRSWLRPYWGKTALIVEVSKYPVSKKRLRRWSSPYLLSPGTPGFIFLVEDWMGLSRQLDDSRNVWEMRRAERRQKRLSRQT